jgi:hypothetical protein
LEILVSQFAIITDAQSIKCLLITVQFIFQKGDKNENNDIRGVFAVKGGFNEALKQLLKGDENLRKYIRAFFRQNLTYSTHNNAALFKHGGSIDKYEKDEELDIFRESESSTNVPKWQKFLNEKLKNIKQEDIEDFVMR